MTKPKIIFFDQWVWINLARSFYGHDNNPIIQKICEKVIKKSDSGEIIFPLIINHFMETIKRGDVESRLRLAEFMVKVSKGYSMLPYCIVTPHEIEQAINKQMDWPVVNLDNFVLRKGFDYLLGGEGEVVGDENEINKPITITMDLIDNFSEYLPTSFKKILTERIGEEINIRDFMKIYFESPDCFTLFCEKWFTKEKDIFTDKNVVAEIERIRLDKKIQFKDKDYRYRAVLAISINLRLLPLMVNYFEKLGKPKEMLENKWMESKLDEFIKDVPTFYVDFELGYQRDNDFFTPVSENDLIDITSLAIAIPYCDIVVFERRFGSFAKQKKLDELYSTTILTNLEELNYYI